MAEVIKIKRHKFSFVHYHDSLILEQDISCTSSVETFKYIRIISLCGQSQNLWAKTNSGCSTAELLKE